jgi:hypothetical protein
VEGAKAVRQLDDEPKDGAKYSASREIPIQNIQSVVIFSAKV